MNTFGCFEEYQKDSEVCQMCEKKLNESISNLNDIREIKIVDPIYGLIEVDNFVKVILDTCYLQRLRRIKQLGFTYLTFPNATHTRFEHSLGVYYLISRICKAHRITGKQEFTLKMAAILHDVGHGPFSHFSEELSEIILGRFHHHEIRTKNMIEYEGGCLNKTLKKLIKAKGYSDDEQEEIITRIKGYIRGKGYISGVVNDNLSLLINGPIDVDKMDYIIRDSYHTGVPFGLGIDLFFICDNINFDKSNGHICFNEKAEASILNLLYSYATSYQAIHFHHVNLIASEMLLKSFSKVDCSSFHDFDKTSFFWADDNNFIKNTQRILEKKQRAQYEEIFKTYLRINNRILYKRAVVMETSNALSLEDRRKEETDNQIITCSPVTKKIKVLDTIKVVERSGSVRELRGYIRSIEDRYKKTIWNDVC